MSNREWSGLGLGRCQLLNRRPFLGKNRRARDEKGKGRLAVVDAAVFLVLIVLLTNVSNDELLVAEGLVSAMDDRLDKLRENWRLAFQVHCQGA